MNDIGPILPDRPEVLGVVDYVVLREWVRDVLHGFSTIGPPFDPRLGIRPFEQLSELFRRADRVVRDRITQALHEFLGELTDTTRWPEKARWDLLDFIQDCGHGVIGDIRAMVRQRTLYDAEGIGPGGHAGLLKCLLSLGVLSDPAWWLEQYELLGPDYGALIFSGLAKHGLDEAVSRLPVLCARDHAARKIRLLIPGLVNRFGLERVQKSFTGQLPLLRETIALTFAEDLEIRVPAAGDAQTIIVYYTNFIIAEVQRAGDTIETGDRDTFRTKVSRMLGSLLLTRGLQAPSVKAHDRLVLKDTAKVACHLASLVSGKGAPAVLWRVCERLLLDFPTRQLALAEREDGQELYDRARKGPVKAVEQYLESCSEPLANAPHRRTPR